MNNNEENRSLASLYQEVMKENKQLRVQIGMLKSDIDMLMEQIERKNAAIKAFKEWQKKLPERTIQIWAKDYIAKLKDPNEITDFRRLIKAYNCEENFHRELRNFIINLRDYMIMHDEVSEERIKVLLTFKKEAGFVNQFEILKKKVDKFIRLREYILEAFTIEETKDNK